MREMLSTHLLDLVRAWGRRRGAPTVVSNMDRRAREDRNFPPGVTVVEER
jgi:hypothetical protein